MIEPLQDTRGTGQISPSLTPTLANQSSESTLRQRKPVLPSLASLDTAHGAFGEAEVEDEKNKEEVSFGKTPSGAIFKVPQTTSFVTTLLSTLHRSSLTRLTFLSLIAQPFLFWYLRNYPTLRSTFFLVYFIFWRGAYDFGFAWVLRQQSERRWVVRLLKEWGWLEGSGVTLGMKEKESDTPQGREWAKWWKGELEMKMGEGYKWEDVPAEFNAWLMFRQLVDIVLLNDFVSYTCFAWSNLHFPTNHSVPLHILRWLGGWSLIFFNLWVKMDAHRVVKDYAWYWGDAFWMLVMQNDLVFDGVYEIAPHPMYSVGYAGYYGLSMVVGSYAVLFVSLAAHAAQFAFLLWFENPHIERTYGGAKKPLAARVPLDWGEAVGQNTAPDNTTQTVTSPIQSNLDLDGQTPAVTEGETTENETDLPETPDLDELPPTTAQSTKKRSDSSYSMISDLPKPSVRPTRRRAKTLTMHDLTNRFFRKPVIVFSRVDVFRATDFALVVLVLYALTTLVPPLPPRIALTAHFLHALSWRLFHSYGLGLLLRAQSKSKWLVRHYLKHYHYHGSSGGGASSGPNAAGEESEDRESVVKRATEEAFGNWQVGYNISLVMTYVSFAGLVWKTYHLPSDWTVSGTILRHVLGSLLVALHIWAASSTYEALGDFGWLYSDFFLIEQIPARLAYTGIYRFLNNPERSMGGAAFFGLWLISNSKLVLTLAVISHLSHWWFLSCVERPHMKRLYGDRLRKDGGLTKTLKSVAGKTLGSKAGRHAPDIQRMVQEVKGSIEKVEGKVSEAVEEFLGHARPMFEDMVNETKVLLQQSRERMHISRVASDISSYDTTRYSMHLPQSSSAIQSSGDVARYHVGQPIRLSWTAPSNHSRKDWIGIYRLGSCKSQLVTRLSSVGKWMPIYEEEYDGDTQISPPVTEQTEKKDGGTVLFKGHQLPWIPGKYELRYHHDGKHNVMVRIAPVEIYVKKPENDSYRAVHDTLLDIVTLSLDSDPNLVPHVAKRRVSTITREDGGMDGVRPKKMSGRDRAGSTDIPSAHKAKSRLSDSAIIEDEGENSDSARPTIANLSSEAKFNPDNPTPMPHYSSGESDGHQVKEEGDDDVPTPESSPEGDPEDFIIMDETQAKRIVGLCKFAFGVELSADVVVADANVGALVGRILGARSLAGKGDSDGVGKGDGGDGGKGDGYGGRMGHKSGEELGVGGIGVE